MTPRPRSSSKKVIYAALLGNLAVAMAKFGAAALTGSSAMLSEAVHSLIDTGNELVLLYGIGVLRGLRTRLIRWAPGASSTSGASSSRC
ncbi:MAG: cation transporter [Rhodospirillales bacterium]|jgi:divalent metal cation (Fe/Co/Zn/Cd) transporter|nr:cation transporter [Rhodospirillales bacterium]